MEWEISNKIKEKNIYLRYNLAAGFFINYNRKLGIYQFIEDEDILRLIIDFIKENPHYQRVETTKVIFAENVLKHLRTSIGKKIEVCSDLCFLNGRLNFKTRKLSDYSPNVYCFNFKNMYYLKTEVLFDSTIKFITNLCNKNRLYINCLRLWLRNCLIRDISDEYGLYLFVYFSHN